MNSLDIIYICDNGFAEVAGISILSLFENNPKEQISLKVHILGVQISQVNKQRFERLGKQYGQTVEVLDATEQYKKIQKLNLSSYRGSEMTNLRLHFDQMISNEIQRVLYIDCDTIVCGKLQGLCDFELNGKLLGMVYDAYGKILNEEKDSAYYNAGVLLIDCERWRREHWCEKIENFIASNTRKLVHPDQDVFNIVCKNEIEVLPMNYNLQVVHREYSERLYFRYLAPETYYTKEEVQDACENPAILHMIRYLGTNPWYTDGKLHPDYQQFQKYKMQSEWAENRATVMKTYFVIRCERMLHKILPKRVFFPISIAAIRFAMKKDENYI